MTKQGKSDFAAGIEDGQPVNRTGRTFENVVTRIRDMIFAGQLKPGDKLPAERDLSARLGIGRNAVREALRALEQAGVIDLRPGKGGGAFVTSGRPDVISDNLRDLLFLGNITLENLWETRLLLADAVVQLAIERMTQEDIAALEANVALANAFYQKKQLREKSRCNIDFHDTLAQATKNPMLMVIMSSVSDQVRHFTSRLGSDPGPETLLSRKRLLKAVRAGNVAAAKQEMRRDLVRVHDFYQSLVRESTVAKLQSHENPS